MTRANPRQISPAKLMMIWMSCRHVNVRIVLWQMDPWNSSIHAVRLAVIIWTRATMSDRCPLPSWPPHHTPPRSHWAPLAPVPPRRACANTRRWPAAWAPAAPPIRATQTHQSRWVAPCRWPPARVWRHRPTIRPRPHQHQQRRMQPSCHIRQPPQPLTVTSLAALALAALPTISK